MRSIIIIIIIILLLLLYFLGLLHRANFSLLIEEQGTEGNVWT